jgi:predicted GIY-YIG superfamily endonuclease
MSRPAVVYRFFNESGVLLYVGVTTDPGSRMRAHERGKPWWTDVTHVTLSHHENLTAALAEEGRAIRLERPRYNLAGAPGRWPTRGHARPDSTRPVAPDDPRLRWLTPGRLRWELSRRLLDPMDLTGEPARLSSMTVTSLFGPPGRRPSGSTLDRMIGHLLAHPIDPIIDSLFIAPAGAKRAA